MRRLAPALAWVVVWVAPGPAHAEDANLAALRAMVEAMASARAALAPAGFSGDDSLGLLVPLARLERTVGTPSRDSVAALGGAWEPRLERDRGYLEQRLRQDADAVRQWWSEGGSARAREALGEERFGPIDQAMERYRDVRQDEAIAHIRTRLDRTEAKYGAGAPRLNLLEVGINYGLQGLPWFSPGLDGPSPNEIVLAYSTSYATVNDGTADAVSVLELGWRRFDLDWRADQGSGVLGLLHPRYVTVGVALAEGRDGALRWPLTGAASQETRLGPFVSWGDLKAAFLFGHESRFIFSRQVQLLPSLF